MSCCAELLLKNQRKIKKETKSAKLEWGPRVRLHACETRNPPKTQSGVLEYAINNQLYVQHRLTWHNTPTINLTLN
jgi:hypothetical protein